MIAGERHMPTEEVNLSGTHWEMTVIGRASGETF